MRSPSRFLLLFLSSTLLLATGRAAPAGEPLAWEVSAGTVTVLCPLTVGGSFEAKSSDLAGRLSPDPTAPGLLSGSLAVDLASLDTGIGFRNQHMRDRYLEVGKGEGFERALLSDLKLDGLDPATASGKARFTAALQVHGVSQPVAGQARLRREGELVRVEAAFPVTTSAFGIPRTEYLGVGVKDELRVTVTLDAREVRNP
jgi:polyisoprenoid-binding protein YceI